MNPLAIAVQGIGFAIALVAVQGFAPIADTVQKPIAPISSNVTTRDWIKVNREDLVKKLVKEAVTVAIPHVQGEGTVEPIVAKGAASTAVPSSIGKGDLLGIKAIGQASARLEVLQTISTLGAIAASGQHDMEDEILLAMLLALLDT